MLNIPVTLNNFGTRFSYKKKVLFRYHRGGFSESMATVRCFYDISDLILFLRAPCAFSSLPEHVITIELYSDTDPRNMWSPVYVVLQGGFPIGFFTFI